MGYINIFRYNPKKLQGAKKSYPYHFLCNNPFLMDLPFANVAQRVFIVQSETRVDCPPIFAIYSCAAVVGKW